MKFVASHWSSQMPTAQLADKSTWFLKTVAKIELLAYFSVSDSALLATGSWTTRLGTKRKSKNSCLMQEEVLSSPHAVLDSKVTITTRMTRTTTICSRTTRDHSPQLRIATMTSAKKCASSIVVMPSTSGATSKWRGSVPRIKSKNSYLAPVRTQRIRKPKKKMCYR